MPPDNSKTRRWIDLVAALLNAQTALTFLEIARKVPAYMIDGSPPTGDAAESLKRAFERDKDELRRLGVPIRSEGTRGDEDYRYRINVGEFYLPYLSSVSARDVGTVRVPKGAKPGYKTLPALAVDSDGLEVIRDAISRVVQLGDPTLVTTVRTAMRKLAFDLPLGAADGRADDVLMPPVARADEQTLARLGDALFRRKTVVCEYHGMGAVESSSRTLEPYGLFFVSGHWYLCARDVDKDALRNFRVSRVLRSVVNKSSPKTSDYEIPESFSLREHARSRRAWEIGDVDAGEAIVSFRGESGATSAARALGEAVEQDSSLRKFTIRRTDSFARWLLSFAGEVMPVSPISLVQEYAMLLRQTRALYDRNAAADHG